MRELKLLLLLSCITVIGFTSCEDSDDDDVDITDPTDSTDVKTADSVFISMSGNYVNDIYYSFENGIVREEPRSNWDIAFYTNTWSSSVIINEGSGVKLYTYPRTDISGWNSTMDTTGLASWSAMYNSDTTWTFSAFEQNMTNGSDYGWGVYNIDNHDVVGDSMYIIKLTDENYKKFILEKKVSTRNVYYFKYANLDGTNEVSDSIDLNNYTGKNFGYYSIVDKRKLDREPATEDWDILFTKYVTQIPDGEGNIIDYTVTGVFQNVGVEAAEAGNRNVEDHSTDNLNFNNQIDIIGSDWKIFDMSTFQYNIEPDLSYFVKAQNDSIYHMVFTSFEGSSTGNVTFKQVAVDN